MKPAPYLVVGTLIACSTWTTGCGSAEIHDADLEPVKRPILLATFDDARLAVDSAESGYRAVLELRLETDARFTHLDRHVPVLHCAVAGVHQPVRIRREPPDCWPPNTLSGPCPHGQPCGDLNQVERTCTHVIRAEYLLDHLPAPSQRFLLTFGQQTRSLQWAKR